MRAVRPHRIRLRHGRAAMSVFHPLRTFGSVRFQPVANIRPMGQNSEMAKGISARLVSGFAIAAGLLSVCSASQKLAPYVSVRSAGATTPSGDADHVLAVRPTGELETYRLLHDTALADVAGATYRVVSRVRGAYEGPPRAAVSAIWRVRDAQMQRQFERSRRDLFALRRQHLSGFHTDLLLEDVARPGRYLIVGLYGREEDLNLARGHPAIVEFSRTNPPVGFGAIEERPLLYYRVLSSRLP